MFKIYRKSDGRVIRAFVHKVADIPNGVNVATSDLPDGAILPEGAVVGKDAATGVFHVVKTALVAAVAGAEATTYTVKKGHLFKIGDVVMLKAGAKAYAITGISQNVADASCEDIRVSTTLGAAAKGDALILAKAQTGGANSALPFGAPYAVVGDSYNVTAKGNIFANAWLVGVVKEQVAPVAPESVRALVSGIHFI